MKPFMEAISTAQPCHDPSQPATLGAAPPGTCQEPCRLNFGQNAATYDLQQNNPLFGFIYTQVAAANTTILSDILAGAFVEFKDTDGCGHKFLTGLPGNYKRFSSHKSTTETVGLREGTVINSVLIGSKTNGITWFQLEGSNFDFKSPDKILTNPLSFVRHTCDTILNLILRKQMGPLGESEHVESNPLRVNNYIAHRTQCPNACVPTTTAPPAAAAATAPAVAKAPAAATAPAANTGVARAAVSPQTTAVTQTAAQQAAVAPTIAQRTAAAPTAAAQAAAVPQPAAAAGTVATPTGATQAAAK